MGEKPVDQRRITKHDNQLKCRVLIQTIKHVRQLDI